MKNLVTPISETELEILMNIHKPIAIETDMTIVYEKQIPNNGVILVEGEIEFKKKRKAQINTKDRCIVGVREVVNNIPIQYSCTIKKNSLIIFLGRSELLNLNESRKELFPLIKKFLTPQ